MSFPHLSVLGEQLNDGIQLANNSRNVLKMGGRKSEVIKQQLLAPAGWTRNETNNNRPVQHPHHH